MLALLSCLLGKKDVKCFQKHENILNFQRPDKIITQETKYLLKNPKRTDNFEMKKEWSLFKDSCKLPNEFFLNLKV